MHITSVSLKIHYHPRIMISECYLNVGYTPFGGEYVNLDTEGKVWGSPNSDKMHMRTMDV